MNANKLRSDTTKSGKPISWGKKLLAGLVVAIQPLTQSQSSRSSQSSQSLPQVERAGPDWESVVESEMDSQCMATVREEYLTKYCGPRTSWDEIRKLQSGKKLANTSLSGRGQGEFESFVAARTR